jgi:excisionase family DNA binding protein
MTTHDAAIQQIPALDTLPRVALRDRHTLPQLCAVYVALSADGQALYIGRSTNLHARWRNHHYIRHLEAMDSISIAWIPCSSDTAPLIEGVMIAHFKPPFNGPGGPTPHPYPHGVLPLTKPTAKVRGGLSTAHAAKRLGITQRRVLAMIQSGRLPARKVGRDWWITEAALEAVKVRKPGRPIGGRRHDAHL